MNKIIKKAFTLAEVLITLGIIGIVAAMTIPTLINNSSEGEYNSGVKLAYSTISRALLMVTTNNGEIVTVGQQENLAGHQNFFNDFAPFLSIVKTGSIYQIFGDSGKFNYRYYKGGFPAGPYPASGDDNDAVNSAVLANGSLIRFHSYDACTYNGVSACGQITVDINGNKLPNMFGKDMYEFWITRQNNAYKIIPFGVTGDGRTCASGSSSWATSDGCTARRLLDPNNMP